MYSKLLFLLLIISPLLSFKNTSDNKSTNSINAVIGDISFTETFDRTPSQYDSEELRITTHLKYVTHILEQADVSDLSNEQNANRSHIIKLLKQYTASKDFPKNYDYKNQRRPTFIDHDGNICAVGYLVQQTKGQTIAEMINKNYKYEYLMKMDSEFLEDWLSEYGITKTEAAMIQPAYGPYYGGKIERTSNKLDVNYAISSSVLLAGQRVILSATNNSSFDLTPRAKTILSFTNSGLGLLSILNGIDGLDRSDRSFYELQESTDQLMHNGVIYSVQEKNHKTKAISISNIVLGSASFLFNGYKALGFRKEQNSEKYSFSTSLDHINGISEPVPTLNLTLNF